MREELTNIAIRIEAWQRELQAIHQQHHHGWALESITPEDAHAAIEAATVIIQELRVLTSQIEAQTERATAMLE